MATPYSGEDAEKLDPSSVDTGNIKQYDDSERQSGCFLTI